MTAAVTGIIILYGDDSEFVVDNAIEILAATPAQFEITHYSSSQILSDKRDELTTLRSNGLIAIYTRCLKRETQEVIVPQELFDYEYLYEREHFSRRDLVRFLSFILGQSKPNDEISKKARSTVLSLTFPDVHDALPNLEIVSVGADALELRVDLLVEKGAPDSIPSLHYVAEQLLALRRRTELPIIFTIRFDSSSGRWPIAQDGTAQSYLRKALQWGVEYLDVASSFSENVKADLVSLKGSSLIIASYHDLKGGLDWSSPQAEQIYRQCCRYGDLVEMVGFAARQKDNFDLENFRSGIAGAAATIPLIAFNTGIDGRFSRLFNCFLTPIKHPLLPKAASPSQLSAAEINKDLTIMGEIKKLTIHTFAFAQSLLIPPRLFFEKCLNELSLPHVHSYSQRLPKSALTAVLRSHDFGGAVIHPPIPTTYSLFASSSSSAMSTGFVDLIHKKDGKLFGHNAEATGIQHTLVREFTPSAYLDQPALIVSHSFRTVASAIYALKSLGCGKIYTVGFTVPYSSPLAENTQACRSLPLWDNDVPFVVISSLESAEARLLTPLLDVVGSQPCLRGRKRILLNLGCTQDQEAASANLILADGWIVNWADDVAAWTAVEMMKSLVGQSVPYDFVRMAGKRGFF